MYHLIFLDRQTAPLGTEGLEFAIMTKLNILKSSFQ